VSEDGGDRPQNEASTEARREIVPAGEAGLVGHACFAIQQNGSRNTVLVCAR